MRFEAHVRDDVRGVCLLDDVRRLFEAGLEVAGLLHRTRLRVAAHEHHRRAGRHRLLHVREMGQRLVADPDESSGIIARSSVSAAMAATASPWNMHSVPISFHAIAVFTPGAFCASVRSMETTRACGSGERTIRP
jgi:hypothetical protein